MKRRSLFSNSALLGIIFPQWRLPITCKTFASADLSSDPKAICDFIEPDRSNSSEKRRAELLALDIKSERELKLLHDHDFSIATLNGIEVFKLKFGKEFIHSGTIGRKGTSVNLLLMSKSKDGYGAKFHSTITVVFSKADGVWKVATNLGKKQTQALGFLSIVEVAAVSNNGQMLFVKVRRQYTKGSITIGVLAWCVIDAMSGKIVYDGCPEACTQE